MTQCSFFTFPRCQRQPAVWTPPFQETLKSPPCPQGWGLHTGTRSFPAPQHRPDKPSAPTANAGELRLVSLSRGHTPRRAVLVFRSTDPWQFNLPLRNTVVRWFYLCQAETTWTGKSPSLLQAFCFFPTNQVVDFFKNR